MNNSRSPSPVVDYFISEIKAALPAEERVKLSSYSASIAATTHRGDFRRAWLCAEWAIQLAERASSSQLGHLVKGLKETHNLWKDTIFGAEFGIVPGDGVGPGEDIEIQWVDDAVAVAKAEAKRTGWEEIPWEDLLKDLLDDPAVE